MAISVFLRTYKITKYNLVENRKPQYIILLPTALSLLGQRMFLIQIKYFILFYYFNYFIWNFFKIYFKVILF